MKHKKHSRSKLIKAHLRLRGKTHVVYVRSQHGKPSVRKLDKKRTALHAGKRVTAWGTVYYERRPNRSDKNRRTRL